MIFTHWKYSFNIFLLCPNSWGSLPYSKPTITMTHISIHSLTDWLHVGEALFTPWLTMEAWLTDHLQRCGSQHNIVAILERSWKHCFQLYNTYTIAPPIMSCPGNYLAFKQVYNNAFSSLHKQQTSFPIYLNNMLFHHRNIVQFSFCKYGLWQIHIGWKFVQQLSFWKTCL